MCTVTFLPADDGSYLLATNRDERPAREPALPPAVASFGGVDGIAPRDPEAGGTWVVVLATGQSVCLLNGDDVPRGPEVAAPVSRGLVCADVAAAIAGQSDVDAESVVRAVLDGHGRAVRPFKLLVVEPSPRPRLQRVEWTGEALTAAATSDAHVAVSSTYCRADVTAARESVFADWVARCPAASGTVGERAVSWMGALERFHSGHEPGLADGDAFSVCMHRDDARSVSSTLIAVTATSVRMEYRRGWPCQTTGAPGDVLARARQAR